MTLKKTLAHMHLLHRDRCEQWHGILQCGHCNYALHCKNDFRANLKATGQDAKKILEERAAQIKKTRKKKEIEITKPLLYLGDG